jgi:hypothetical protein
MGRANKNLVYIGKQVKLKFMRIAPVFELIKTLSPAEIKMLKQRAQSGDVAFLALLKIMANAESKSDSVFKSEFEKLHKEVDYTETKSYLYYYILQHLTERSSKANDFSSICYDFVTAEMLGRRGLVKEAINILQNSDEIAAREDYHQLRVVALKRLLRLKFITTKTDSDYKQLEELHKAEMEQLELEKVSARAFILYARFVRLIERHGGPVNEQVEKQFLQIVNDEVVKNYRAYNSVQVRTICFDLLTNYYYLVNDLTSQRKEYIAEVKRLQKSNLKNPYNAYRYLFILFNLVGIVRSGKESELYVALLKSAPSPDENTRRYKELFILQHAFARLKPDEADARLKELKNAVKAPWLANKEKELMSMMLLAIRALIILGQFKNAEELITGLVNNRETEKVLPAHFIGVRLFHLIVLYELNRFDEIEPVIRSLSYFSKAKELKSDVVSALLTLFQKLGGNTSSAKKLEALKKAQKAIAGARYFQYVQFGLSEFIDSKWLQHCELKLKQK